MGAKYAQHFLTNRHAAERIAGSLELTPNDAVLEIGPGKGALTAFLLKAKRVAVVEIDPLMVERLRARFGSSTNVTVIPSDILEFDFSQLDSFLSTGETFKVVGNLPYNLTSPILRRLSDWNRWSAAFVMVQKEVADRLCARAGTADYGALTVGVSLTCEIQRVFDLSRTSFDPPPKVESSIVKLTRRAAPLTDDVPATQRVIQAAFQQRRKTILNSLSHGLQIEKQRVEQILEKVGVTPETRAERITIPQFLALSRAIFGNGGRTACAE